MMEGTSWAWSRQVREKMSIAKKWDGRHRKPGNRSLTSRGPSSGSSCKSEEKNKCRGDGGEKGRRRLNEEITRTTVTLISEHEVDEGLMTM